MTTLLEVEEMHVSYGGVRAVDGMSIVVGEGELVGLIGPNGAGKTSLIDGITGFTPADGSVRLRGHDVSGLSAHARVRLGLARTWQSIELFDDLTVIENLLAARDRSSARELLMGVLRRESITEARSSVEQVLDRFDLSDVADRLTTELSHGERKLVGMARALIMRPTVICMDEPAAGLDSSESQSLGRRLRSVVADGTSICLVDHDMQLVLAVCDRIYVMDSGRLLAHGTPPVIRKDARVISAYLGGSPSQQDVVEVP